MGSPEPTKPQTTPAPDVEAPGDPGTREPPPGGLAAALRKRLLGRAQDGEPRAPRVDAAPLHPDQAVFLSPGFVKPAPLRRRMPASPLPPAQSVADEAHDGASTPAGNAVASSRDADPRAGPTEWPVGRAQMGTAAFLAARAAARPENAPPTGLSEALAVTAASPPDPTPGPVESSAEKASPGTRVRAQGTAPDRLLSAAPSVGAAADAFFEAVMRRSQGDH